MATTPSGHGGRPQAPPWRNAGSYVEQRRLDRAYPCRIDKSFGANAKKAYSSEPTKTGEERSIPLPAFFVLLGELQIPSRSSGRNRELFGADYQEEKDLIFAAPDGALSQTRSA